MNNNILILLVVIVLVILIVWFLTRPSSSSPKCKNDTDCENGVCHDGKCVECAFDTDCCGSDVCFCGRCEACSEDPPTLIAECSEIDLPLGDSVSDMDADMTDLIDLKLTATAGSSPIDWTTLEFGRISAFTTYNDGPPSPDLPGCVDALAGTVVFPTFDILGAGIHYDAENATPGSTGILTLRRLDGPDAGSFDTFTATHDDDGVLSFTLDYESTNQDLNSSYVFQIPIRVSGSCAYSEWTNFYVQIEGGF